MMGATGKCSQARFAAGTMLNAGYVVVSIDYRLAPKVKLPAIIEDIRDAYDWCAKRGRSFSASS